MSKLYIIYYKMLKIKFSENPLLIWYFYYILFFPQDIFTTMDFGSEVLYYFIKRN